MSLWSVIADNSSAIYAVCIPGFLIAGGYVVWKSAFADGPKSATTPVKGHALTPRRPLAAGPSTKPKSLAAGEPEHQARGEAKTVKVPVAVPLTLPKPAAAKPMAGSDDDVAKDALFAGLGETPAASEETTLLRKAERMEELGFHLQARSQPIPGQPSESGDQPKTEQLKAPIHSSAVETQSLSAPVETPSVAGARTQTQELDDILSRIDKVLSDNPVMAEMTLGSDSNAVPKQPTTEATKKKTETPEVPGQQKLF